jgi:hypothetical protein
MCCATSLAMPMVGTTLTGNSRLELAPMRERGERHTPSVAGRRSINDDGFQRVGFWRVERVKSGNLLHGEQQPHLVHKPRRIV